MIRPILVVLLGLQAGSSAVQAHPHETTDRIGCMALVPRTPGPLTYIDGPGSFGPWHGTVTLDCLRQIGFRQGEHGPEALLEDHRGMKRWVMIGETIGENEGRIMRITEKGLNLILLLRTEGGSWKEAEVFFPAEGQE
jgi:hypothetical protein